MQLPSGREIEFRPATYGDVLEAEDEQYKAGPGVNTAYRFLITRLTGLTPAEVNDLSVADGQALAQAIRRVTEGKPAEVVVPSDAPSGDAPE